MSRQDARVQPSPVTEWTPPEGRARVTGKPLVVLALLLPLVPAIAAAVAWGGFSVWIAVALGAIDAGWVLGQRRFHLAGSSEARVEEHSRFVNIARGVAADLGQPVPRLYVSSAPGRNALVIPGAIAVTKELLESYTRTELEAVIAHCLVRLDEGGLGWALAAAAAGGSTRWGTPPVDRHVDARAAAVTRYPPALASAIEKATPRIGRRAGLSFVADAPSHTPAKERAAELRDL